MINIIITTHKGLASGIKSAYEMIAGQNDNIRTLELDDTGIKSYKNKLVNLLDSVSGVDTLVLCDLKGGTPFNESFKYYLAHKDNLRVISGVNLPMLLEISTSLKGKKLEELTQIALNAGEKGITEAEDESADSDDNDDIEF